MEKISENEKPQLPEQNLSEQETTSRRALIQKYGKYAAVAGPLLLFVSKAHAIHSRP